jgi:DNA-binding transcriptional LysR family regulator
MDLRQLRYFSEVASVGTFLGAAARLHVADPAVWKQVRALERELGLTLFERVGRRVRLTRAGVLLRERADLTLASADRVRQLANDLAHGRAGTVVVACGASHVPRFVSPVLARFERAHPDIQVQMREYQSTADTGDYDEALSHRLEDLFHGVIDLITTPPVGGDVDGFIIFRGRLVAALPPDDPRLAQGCVPIQSLRGEPLLVLPSNTPARRLLEQACRAAGFEPWVKAESSNASTIVALGRAGCGTPVTLDYVLETAGGTSGIPILDDGKDFRLPVWLYWRKGAALLPAVDAFIAEAREYVSHCHTA